MTWYSIKERRPTLITNYLVTKQWRGSTIPIIARWNGKKFVYPQWERWGAPEVLHWQPIEPLPAKKPHYTEDKVYNL